MSVGQLGIAVRDQEVAALLTGLGARRSFKASVQDADDDWPAVFEMVFEALPAARNRRLRVTLLLGGSFVRHKRLFGVAPELSLSEVSAKLEESPRSFFLGRAEQMVTSAPARVNNEWWAAAIDRTVVNALVTACESRGYMLSGVLPLEPGTGAAPLETLALTATGLRGSEPFFVDPNRRIRERRHRMRRRGLLVALLIAGLIGTAFGPPTIRLARAAALDLELHEARAGLDAKDVADRVAFLNALDEQRRVQRMLASVPLHSELLSLVAEALPDSTAIVSFVADSLAIHVVVLAAPSNDVLAPLEAISQVRNARLAGPVVRERLGAAELQRARLAFRVSARSEQP